MLTKELAIAGYDNGRLLPDRLTRQGHRQYTAYAERMLEVYRTGLGRTRRELHTTVHGVFAEETDCPLRRIEAFCKLLDDASTFAQGRRGAAAALRRNVFRRAAALHPLVRSADRLFSNEEAAAKAAIAAELGLSWAEIDRQLFADVMECHHLAAFAGYPSPEALLARYNVAQVQVALFRAVEMIVWATDEFKTILRYAKLARLMHTIRRLGESRYELKFDGPVSVLRATRRYGVALAKFLPALVACRGWRLHAVLQTRRPGWLVSLDLSAEDGLHSHLPPPEEFDSQLEEDFARRWGLKRDGWTLDREGAILHQGQKTFVPDFVFRHADGRAALLEIVGFWTPEYLQAKFQTLRAFPEHRILVAVPERTGRQRADVPAGAIRFKTALRPKEVLERLTNSMS
jgi:predicted nuclease of restriction endonuclease-like RecB superfamily